MRIRIHRRSTVRRVAWALGALASMGMAASARAADAPPKEPDAADMGLAYRFAELGQNTVRSQTVVDATFRMSGVLFEAAARLNPLDPRYPRLQADALLQARDPEGAIKALRGYLALQPEDQFAQVQFAELVANRFESLDQRLAYLKDKVGDDRVPAPVRAHLAFRAAQVCTERADSDGTKLYLDAAIKLNPISLEALRAYYQEISTSGTPEQRVSTLLAVLRSNPNQPEAAKALAQQLADAGLVQQSVQFWGLGLNLAGKAGAGVSREEAFNYGCELYLLSQGTMTRQIVDQLLPANYNDYELAILRLLAERAGETKAFGEKSLVQTQNTFINRLASLRKVSGDSTATTRPIDSIAQAEMGDLSADARKVKAGVKPPEPDPSSTAAPLTADQIRDAWSGFLADLAWYQIYIVGKPVEAKATIDALKVLAGESAPTVARLEGWQFLMAGQLDEAKVKLSAVAETDPIARLGLIKVSAADPANAAKAKADGEKLLQEHPSQMVAVIIEDALRDLKVTLTPAPARVAPINAALGKFPMDWLQILDRPAAFYQISIEPLRVANNYGDPILVRVAIRNVSEYPITLGPDGVLHQDLWFDAFFRGMTNQGFPGTAIDRLSGPLVLPPQATLVQDVRLDQGPLSGTLQTSPLPSLQIVAQVKTNPTGNANVAPASQTATNSRSIERTGFSLDRFPNLVTALSQSSSAEKLREIDLASAVASVLASQGSNDQTKQGALQLIEAIRVAQRDASPSVAAWAAGAIALRTPEADRAVAIQRLVNDPNWQSRFVGLALAGILPPEAQRALAKQIAESDTDPLVRRYAAAVLELAAQAPATKPATGPTSAPATLPATPR